MVVLPLCTQRPSILSLSLIHIYGTYDKIINKYLDNNKSKEKSSTNVPDETTIVGLIKNNYKQLLQGLGITLGLTLLSFAIAMIIGIIFGMMAVAPNKTLRVISQIFVDVVRGIPLMIVAAFTYWGIPNLSLIHI